MSSSSMSRFLHLCNKMPLLHLRIPQILAPTEIKVIKVSLPRNFPRDGNWVLKHVTWRGWDIVLVKFPSLSLHNIQTVVAPPRGFLPQIDTMERSGLWFTGGCRLQSASESEFTNGDIPLNLNLGTQRLVNNEFIMKIQRIPGSTGPTVSTLEHFSCLLEVTP